MGPCFLVCFMTFFLLGVHIPWHSEAGAEGGFLQSGSVVALYQESNGTANSEQLELSFHIEGFFSGQSR